MIQTQYAITQYPTPVLNTPDFKTCFGGESGDDLPLDEQNLMRTVEVILFPGTKVELLQRVANSHIWKITTNEYKSTQDIYIDDRFVKTDCESFPEREIKLPSIPEIVKRMSELVGTPYIWGGNCSGGVELLPTLYPSKTNMSELSLLIQNTWCCRGVDCTGFVFEITNGFSPRNSAEWLDFGDPIEIENKNARGILKELQTLDAIVWKGHLIIVLDSETLIESIPPNKIIQSSGVVKFNALQRLEYIMKERVPVNTPNSTDKPHFVVRRWHPHNK